MEDPTNSSLKQSASRSSQHQSRESCKPTEQDCGGSSMTTNQCYTVNLFGVPIAALVIDGIERLCLAQISTTLLKKFSYNEIHNRRVALGINCVQCTPVQLEILRRANAMPVSSRRCGMINKREAERLCKSFLTENTPPKLPDNFSFDVYHECTWGCRGAFVPSRYNSSRAKCIRCTYCNLFSSPNKFIFHAHRTPTSKFHPPDGPNFNSWRRHIKLVDPNPPEDLLHAWEDVKAMFNGGSRKRSFCESSSKLAPSSFGRAVGDSLGNEAQRLLPSPPKRNRYQQNSHGDRTTPPVAVGISYPLMPIPSRPVSSSIGDSLPEDHSMASTLPYPVGAIFPGQLSPPAFRQNPFMELVWGGGRAGYPIQAASLWPKALRMPFPTGSTYYPPLVDPDTDMHTVAADMTQSRTGTSSKKSHQWDDLDSAKLGGLIPKTLPSSRHHYLPDLRPRSAYYSSAFQPVLTGKGLLDNDRPFVGAERFLFPTKMEDCCLSVRQHHANLSPHHLMNHHHHQVKIKMDKDRSIRSPTSLTSPKTLKVTLDAADPADKPGDSEATANRSPSSAGRSDTDAGANSPDGRAESRRDLEKFRPKRNSPVEEAVCPRDSPDSLLLGNHLSTCQHHHHDQPARALSRTPSPDEESEGEVSPKQPELDHHLSSDIDLRQKAYLAMQQKYRENLLPDNHQGPLNHFARRILSTHGGCMD